jgi:AcrR family transcriptional regulator
MGIKERKEREKLHRKNQIIKTAEKIFLKKGFDKTSMDEIAEKAELSKGVLYLYFKNKKDLYLALAYNILIYYEKNFIKIAKKKISDLDKLKSIMSFFLNTNKKYKEFDEPFRFFENCKADEFTDKNSYLFKCLKVKSKLHEIVDRILQNCAEDKAINDKIDLKLFSLILQGMLNGVNLILTQTHSRLYYNEKFTEEQKNTIINDFLSIIFDGIVKR